MPSIIPKNYFCAKCKKDITKKICDCGTKGKPQPPYSVRFRWVNDDGIEVQKKLSNPRWTTQFAAQRGYEEWISAHPNGKRIQTKTLDFMFLYGEYKNHLRTTVKESSYVAFIQRLDKFVVPAFKDKKVNEITPLDIVKWQNNLSSKVFSTKHSDNKVYSAKYKIAIRSALNHFFEYLKIYDIDNPLNKIKGFKKSAKPINELSFWTEDEFTAFIKVVDNTTYRTLFSFLYLTGCRKGETLALTWRDIDFQKKTVNINKTLSKYSLDGMYHITSPKTNNSYRTIPLPNMLIDMLNTYKPQSERIPEQFVFGGETYLPFNTVRNYFKRYIQIAHVKDIRLHDLRHSHVSLLINKGDNQLSTIYVIAARLGDTVEMIMKTYGHLFPDVQQELIDKLSLPNF